MILIIVIIIIVLTFICYFVFMCEGYVFNYFY